MKVYDCFQFFNELDLLEIRLELLYDVVDHFVIVESNKTHSNDNKTLYFMDNREKYIKYLDKIIHVVSDFPSDMLNVSLSKRNTNTQYDIVYNSILDLFDKTQTNLKNEPSFARDYFQRDFIKLGLLNCEPDDMILISDLDEIPNPSIVEMIKNEKLFNHVVLMDCHNYYINNLLHTNWFGTYAVKYSDIEGNSFSGLRDKSSKEFSRIENGGWHLSFMGGEERIKKKIQSYAHQELNNQYVLNSVKNRMENNTDVFGRSDGYYGQNGLQKYYFNQLQSKDISNGYYPEKMMRLINEKYSYLIKK
jgi:beta-1,4-mannosyl-glycoprotein beta-1,4-N-acetylglucosaminyltransferase